MNSIVIVFLCVMFLGESEYFYDENHSYHITYLVAQQGVDGVMHCYICERGTDGCGPLFRESGSGVGKSNSSAACCTVRIFSMFL
jgi:hypothetical protein